MGILVSVLIGAVAGWLASKFMKSNSNGILMNIILGILGGYVGNWLFGLLNISGGGSWVGIIITSTIGAAVLIFIAKMIFKKGK